MRAAEGFKKFGNQRIALIEDKTAGATGDSAVIFHGGPGARLIISKKSVH